jgi:hypothetical protein
MLHRLSRRWWSVAVTGLLLLAGYVWIKEGLPPAAEAAAPARVRRRGPRRPTRAVAQKPPVPLGVPSPVGPSHPVRALHHWVVGQLPLLPDVTSKNELAWVYG